MNWLDFIIFGLYMAGILIIGFYFYRKNQHLDDYYVGGRNLSSFHVGLSIAATDVGGGFSIGLGGLGYLVGLSGSWLLFTGIIGAWLSAILIIPRIKKIDIQERLLTYPQFLGLKYDRRVAFLAGIISGIGYLGFTSAQVLAGAKLASVTLFENTPYNIDPFLFSIILIGLVIVVYTGMGGLNAVIYTDSFQWIILITGLIFFGIPFAVSEAGGLAGLRASLPAEFFTLTNITWSQFVNWMVTIVPVWFVAMTIYQRIYACRDVKQAQRAWYIGGLFEYPLMAFTGTFLGMCSRALYSNVEAETGLILLIRDVLPVGITGLIIAAYFSAIMSTADSCLMASSGNFVNDLIAKVIPRPISDRLRVRLSQLMTIILGVVALTIAGSFQTVLNAILYTYSFLVSGLLVPTLGAYFCRVHPPVAAIISMLTGGITTIVLQVLGTTLPWALDPTLFGIAASALTFFGSGYLITKSQKTGK